MAVAQHDLLLQAFGSTSLPSYSFPQPVGYTAAGLPIAFKEADINKKQGVITAYLTVYNNDDGSPFIDPYQDIIEPGSFSKTISDLDASRNKKHNPWYCPNLWQHDRYELIGGIARLGEDSKGVIYEAQLAMGVRRAQEALELAELKMLGSSYGYDPMRFDILAGNIRKLKEIKLREVSQVTFPANDIAPILGTKQRWAWSHVPTQAATVFDNIARSLAPQSITSDVVTKNKKARDFATIWQARQMHEVYSDLCSMIDCLMSSIMDIVTDEGVQDEGGALGMTIDQFKSEITGAWLSDYEAADAAEDANMPPGTQDNDMAEMIGEVLHANLSAVALKHVHRYLSSKSGRVLSADNKKRLASAIMTVSSELTNIQTWLDELDLDEGKQITRDSTLTSKMTPVISVPSSDRPTPHSLAPTTPQFAPVQEVSAKDFLAEVQKMFGSQDATHTAGVS